MARERELEAISTFLDLDPADGQSLLLEGEAGIGKTALWRAGTDMASDRGYRVLSCSAAESETQLAFTSLRDLLTDAFDEVADELPSPQRRALAVVLLREDPVEGPVEPATVAIAFLTTLRLLASRTPILLAIDDVQWADPASADVVRYVLRRIGGASVSALLARRTPAGSPPFASGVEVLEVGPFSVGALGRILGGRLGFTYPRRTLQRVHAVSGGNPFYALEIARAVGNLVEPLRPSDPLPVPGTLLQLVRERIASFPPPTLEALTIASALSRPTLDAVSEALGSDALPLLRPAVDADVVGTDGTAVWFSHPLFAAAVYEMAAPRWGEIHARLAPIVGDVEERARHLVRANVEPDAGVAASIDAGAAAAGARGALGAAAELAAAAARLTPPDSAAEAIRRLLDAVDWHLAADDPAAARRLLEPLPLQSLRGPDRAALLLRLARTSEPHDALPLFERALEDAAGEPELQATVQLAIAEGMLSTQGAAADLAAAVRAVELAEAAGSDQLIMAAKGLRLEVEALIGQPVDPATVAVLTDQFESYGGTYAPAQAAALWLMYRDRLDEAREVLEELERRAAARGDDASASGASFFLAELECRAGRYEVAAERASKAQAYSIRGLDQGRSAYLYAAALADTYLGHVEEARSGAERGLALARSVSDTIFDIQNAGVLGFLDLSLGEPRAAADRLAPLWPRIVELGYGEPSVFPVLPNAIHSLLEAGDWRRAEPLLDQLQERGRALGSAWALSQAARLRALLAADDGNPDEALRLIDEALALHERMPGPFERGRTLLALGAILRRARHKREAREALGEALAIFEDLGTPLWVAKAQSELARISGRAPSAGDLTPTERRIAELVSEGKTNKEVAAILVVADRSVESALTHIYRKLDVRSRTELARKFAERE